MGGKRNKVLLELHERPVVAWSIAAFAGHREIDRVIVVGHRDDLTELRQITEQIDESIRVLEGGTERADSERAALEYLRPDIDAGKISLVAIHDGARPLLDTPLIDRVIHAAQKKHGVVGAIPMLPAPALVQVADGDIRTLAHLNLVRVQTPQAFAADLLLRAYDDARREGFTGTDTSSYVERACNENQRIVGVPGDDRNLKVTFTHDLVRASALANDQR